MGDERLRELARRSREAGTPDAEGAYLNERLRRGLLTRERLELAAYCGSVAAGHVCPRLPNPDHDLWEWAEGLVLVRSSASSAPGSPAEHISAATTTWCSEVFAREVIIRATLAAAECVSHVAAEPQVTRCMQLIRQWVEHRDEASAKRVRDAADQLERTYDDLASMSDYDAEDGSPRLAAVDACRLAAGVAALEGSDLKAAARVVDCAARASSPDTVRTYVASALVAWALAEA